MDKYEKRAIVKRYLVLPNEIDDELKELFTRYEELETQATHITQTLSPVTVQGNGGGKIETIVIQMVNISGEIERKLYALYMLREKRSEMIGAVPDLQQRAILQSYFVDRQSYGAIARVNRISKDAVKKAVTKAVDRIGETMD